MNELLRVLLNLPEQASTFAAEVDLLHYAVILVTMAGATGVFTVVLWFTIRYRRRREGELTPQVSMPPAVELGLVLGLLSLFVVFWVVGYRQYLTLRTAPVDATEIYVTGKQWMWKFAYPHGARTNAVLVVPAGRPVKLILTSRDVIHSFFVPAFRQKMDVLPGRYTTTWFEVKAPGVYRTYCAEYCGTGHSTMWADVVALDPTDWEAWRTGEEPPDLVGGLVERPADRGALETVQVHEAPRGLAAQRAPASMATRGLDVAARKGCLSCHSVDGQRHIGPSFRGLYGSRQLLADGTAVEVDEAYLTRSMMEPMAEIAAGFPPMMPTYAGQLRPAEVGALLELIKSLRWPLPEAPRIEDQPLPEVGAEPSGGGEEEPPP